MALQAILPNPRSTKDDQLSLLRLQLPCGWGRGAVAHHVVGIPVRRASIFGSPLTEHLQESGRTLPDSLLIQDAIGLSRTPDYLICKNRAGDMYTCTPLVAALVEVVNVSLLEGIPQLSRATLLETARNRRSL
jgi:hypothetical protein